jgi:hypothetical protein
MTPEVRVLSAFRNNALNALITGFKYGRSSKTRHNDDSHLFVQRH